MKFSYQSLINVGAHLGDFKKNYTKQMGFYALGFRNDIFIFNSSKTLLNIINVLIILKKIILYNCNILGYGNRFLIDNNNILKNFFYKLNQHWVFGKVVGGTLSNRRVSLWRNSRWITRHENFYFRKAVSSDCYFVINNHNTLNLFSELINDYSIIISLNDSNAKIEGIPYFLPYNTKSTQSLFLIMKIMEQYLYKSSLKNQEMRLYNKSLYFYNLYLKRLLQLRSKIHNSKFFVNFARKRYFKKTLSMSNALLNLNYNKKTSYFLRPQRYLKKRPKKKRKAKYLKLAKTYTRNNFRSLIRDIFYKRWCFYTYKTYSTQYHRFYEKSISNKKYLSFTNHTNIMRAFKKINFSIKNRRVYNKMLDFYGYKFFFELSLARKNVLRSPMFFKRPRLYFSYISKLVNKRNILKNFLYLKKPKNLTINFLTARKFFKSHRIFHKYIFPKEWTYYTKYTVFSKKARKSKFKWFPNYNKYKQQKHRKFLDKRKKRRDLKLKDFDARYNKRFNRDNLKNKKHQNYQQKTRKNQNYNQKKHVKTPQKAWNNTRYSKTSKKK